VADKLQLLPEDVTSGKARVKISGRDYQVLGIFRQEKLDALLDLDGQSLLPIDVVALRAPPMTGDSKRSAESAELPEDQPRLPAEAVILTPFDAMPERTQVASVAVGLAADKASGKAMGYGEARKLVTAHLERSGEAAYYGLDGISFFGGKFRMQSVEGLLDLILPILISALTVLNTMRGSVYERRSELYVFNAVGLAPNHIRYLFLAEACVYAVVGAVGGYLLAQGVSFGLDVLGLKKTLGLTMNYSSLSVIIVTLAIMGVVVASSILPARMAARLAAPAEHMTRQRATAEADVLTLDLPFTFNRRDRIAIVPYMADWFGNYGEGSSGEFFSSPAEIGVRMEEYLSTPPEIGVRREATGLAPFVRTTTWLKPYDLGVSQTVEVVVRFVPETRDHLATVILTRRSGDKESWERCCHAFMGMLRKRFLTWRAVADGDRQALLERGKKLLTEGTTGSS